MVQNIAFSPHPLLQPPGGNGGSEASSTYCECAIISREGPPCFKVSMPDVGLVYVYVNARYQQSSTPTSIHVSKKLLMSIGIVIFDI